MNRKNWINFIFLVGVAVVAGLILLLAEVYIFTPQNSGPTVDGENVERSPNLTETYVVETDDGDTDGPNGTEDLSELSKGDGNGTRKTIPDLPGISRNPKSLNGKKTLSVYVEVDGDFSAEFSEKLSGKHSKKFNTSAGLFNYESLKEKYYRKLLSNDPSFLSELGLSEYTDYLCIGSVKFENSYKNSRDMITTDLSLNVKYLDVNTNKTYQVNKLISGVGFNATQSKMNAIDRAVDYLIKNSI